MIIGISGKIGSGKDTVGSIIQYLTSRANGNHSLAKDKPLSSFMSYKDYTDGFVTHNYIGTTWEIRKFAAKVKTIVALLTGCTVEDLESQEFKNQQLGEEWNWYTTYITDADGRGQLMRSTPTEEAKKMLPFPNRIKPYTYREMLQRVGTEAMRNMIHEDVWVNALFADYIKDRGYIYKASFVDKDPININDYKDSNTFTIKIPKDSFPEPYDNGFPNWIITDMRFPNEMKAIKDRGGITIRIERLGQPVNNHPSETSLDDATFDYVVNNDGSIDELVEMVQNILIKENIINEIK